jgi:chemotaxis protein CheD
MKNENVQIVGMSSMKTAQENEVLVSYGVGSCIVLVMYDAEITAGALAHAMIPLPSSKQKLQGNPYRYVESTIDNMITALLKMGALKSRLEAKVIGGASMFKVFNQDSNSIGKRNVSAAQKKLQYEGIKTIATDTGGNAGRSVKFFVSTGVVEVVTKL